MTIPTDRASFKAFCLKNKYSKWYFNIVDRAIERNWKKKKSLFYVESHHVIPRALTKEKQTSGLRVCLTAREHFICHLLLPKMIEDAKLKGKMFLALHRLLHGNKQKYCSMTSSLYKKIQEEHSKAASIRSKEYWVDISPEKRHEMRAGDNYKGHPCTEEMKNKISKANKGKLAGEKHFLWRIGHTVEAKLKMKETAPRSSLGKTWYNDGVNSFLVFKKDANIKWNVGRINMNVNINHTKPCTGMKWFNDGVKSYLLFPHDENAKQLNSGRIKTW